jgi:hypothetical protein
MSHLETPTEGARLVGAFLEGFGTEWCIMEIPYWPFQSNIYVATAMQLRQEEQNYIRSTFELYRHPAQFFRVSFAHVKVWSC